MGRHHWMDALVVLWVCCLACGSGPSEGQQARSLLARLSELETNSPLAERQRQIERLGKLRLSAPHLTAVRDACVRAHRGLLESEVAQAEAKRGLAGRRPDQETGQRAGERGSLQALLRESEAKLKAARAAYPACRDQTRALVKRFRE